MQPQLYYGAMGMLTIGMHQQSILRGIKELRLVPSGAWCFGFGMAILVNLNSAGDYDDVIVYDTPGRRLLVSALLLR